MLKVDDSTLPLGHSLTSANPRAIQVTPGKAAQANFGIAPSCAIALSLSDQAFAPQQLQLLDQWTAQVDQLFSALEGNHAAGCSALIEMRTCEGVPAQLTDQRLLELESLLKRRFDALSPGQLSVQTTRITSHSAYCQGPVDSLLFPQGTMQTIPQGSFLVDPATLDVGQGAGRFAAPRGFSLMQTPQGQLFFVPEAVAAGWHLDQPRIAPRPTGEDLEDVYSSIDAYQWPVEVFGEADAADATGEEEAPDRPPQQYWAVVPRLPDAN